MLKLSQSMHDHKGLSPVLKECLSTFLFSVDRYRELKEENAPLERREHHMRIMRQYARIFHAYLCKDLIIAFAGLYLGMEAKLVLFKAGDYSEKNRARSLKRMDGFYELCALMAADPILLEKLED